MRNIYNSKISQENKALKAVLWW